MTMLKTDTNNLRIAIVGGGIGGLTCAIALKNCKNIKLDLYEAAPELSEIGAGVTVWPRTWTLLKALGLDEALIQRLKEPPQLDEPKIGFTFRKSDQREGLLIHDMMTNGGSLNFHRKDIQQALMQQLPSFCNIHLNHRLVKSIETSGMVELEFLNGNRAECDLLVGADGIKSVVRRRLKDGHHRTPIFSGSKCFRGLVPREKLEKLNPDHRTLYCPTMYLGKNRHIVVYPISQNSIINVVAFHSNFENFRKPLNGPEVRDATLEEVLREYEDWEVEVKQLLQCIENPTCWAIQDVDPLDSYVGRQSLVLGDAAHAMTPHLGAGAGQAMEDAYILGAIISATGCQSEDIPRILKTYDAIRRPFCNWIVQASRQQVRFYELAAPELQEMKEGREGERILSEQQMSILANTISGNWQWASSSVDKDHQLAVSMIMDGSNRSKL